MTDKYPAPEALERLAATTRRVADLIERTCPIEGGGNPGSLPGRGVGLAGWPRMGTLLKRLERDASPERFDYHPREIVLAYSAIRDIARGLQWWFWFHETLDQPAPHLGRGVKLTRGEPLPVGIVESLRLAADELALPTRPASEPETPTRPAGKRSTARGDARLKIVAALTKHHQYAAGSLLNQEPASVAALATRAGVSKSTASGFFTAEFNGHAAYQRACRDNDKLITSLKLLNNEFSPSLLYGSDPDRTPEGD